tara:strand:- start:3 stop:266 length:264 start_codon:yes stop_codon:yes gene_type:complete
MEPNGVEEQQPVEATQPQQDLPVKTIAGVLVVLIVLVLIVAFTPLRGILESWWSDYRDQQKLNELERFEQEQPQGDLTTEDKFNAIR